MVNKKIMCGKKKKKKETYYILSGEFRLILLENFGVRKVEIPHRQNVNNLNIMNSVFLKIVQFFKQLGPLKKRTFEYSKMAETPSDEISKSSFSDLDLYDLNLPSDRPIIRMDIKIQPIEKDAGSNPEIDKSSSTKSDSSEEKEKFLKRAVNLIPKRSKKKNGMKIDNRNHYYELEIDEEVRKTYFKLFKTGTIHLLRLLLISVANKMLKIEKNARKNLPTVHRRGKNFRTKGRYKFKLAFIAYFQRSSVRAKHFSVSGNAPACPALGLPQRKISPLKACPRHYSHDRFVRKRPKSSFKQRYQNCDDNNNDADNEYSSGEE